MSCCWDFFSLHCYCTKPNFFFLFFFVLLTFIPALSFSLEKTDLSYSEPRTDAGNKENMLKFPQEELPFKFPPRPGASGGAGSGRSLPAHVFQPAVLLSPPRQKSSQELSALQNGEISLAVVDLGVCVVCYCFNCALPLEMYFLWNIFNPYAWTYWPYSWNILLLHPDTHFFSFYACC